MSISVSAFQAAVENGLLVPTTESVRHGPVWRPRADGGGDEQVTWDLPLYRISSGQGMWLENRQILAHNRLLILPQTAEWTPTGGGVGRVAIRVPPFGEGVG